MNNEEKIMHLIDEFFKKQPNNTANETCANYENGLLKAGGENGLFYTHINRHTMKSSLLELIKQKNSYYIFVETGCAAHGTKSTILWDKFVNLFNGKVYSVDLNETAVNETNNLTTSKTTVVCSDSLIYLPTLNEKIDFLYLDSYDVDFLNPLPSAQHHLKEFNSVKHLLHTGSIILIDDTPHSPEWLDNGQNSPMYKKLINTFNPEMSGKGSLVNKELEKMGAKKLIHQYQVLWML